MIDITLSGVTDFPALGKRWRALEAEADPSFFQSWTWTGCLAEERFPDPVLLEAGRDGRTVALGLFNRRRRPWPLPDRLWLGESGRPTLDALFIEYNGLLLARGEEASLSPQLKAVLRARLPGTRRRRKLVLSGVDDAYLAAARATGARIRVRQTRPVPLVDLAKIRMSDGCYLASLSANTRYQLRRSERRYAAAGPVRIERAATPAQAHRHLAALAVLHEATWTRRGHPGAFANRNFARFHHALIDRARPGEVDMLHIAAGERTLGYLYNFFYRGRVLAYQSGFDYATASPQEKPGLTSHRHAIEMALREGATVYDFLGGGDRYKTSLANAAASLHWLEMTPGLKGVFSAR